MAHFGYELSMQWQWPNGTAGGERGCATAVRFIVLPLSLLADLDEVWQQHGKSLPASWRRRSQRRLRSRGGLMEAARTAICYRRTAE